ncbi:MAG TPA: type III pantothenate kinase [Armatimonadota bacterium]|nr:type III pantothenate kinase [Armatimonadota bacterium]
MLLAINVNNTNIALGVFENSALAADWRVSTKLGRTADEYGMLFNELLEYRGLSLKDVSGIIISNVVPPTMRELLQVCHKYSNLEPYVVDAEKETGIVIHYQPRSNVGADRIANAVAAFALYGGPAIVVDLGTATTFDAISATGEYMGGAIAPGVIISLDALSRAASRLPRIDLVRPPAAIGTTTETSMQAGVLFGFAGQVDEMVRRFKRELGEESRVISTGGLAELISPETQTVQIVNRLLTLEGLRLIWERNSGAKV